MCWLTCRANGIPGLQPEAEVHTLSLVKVGGVSFSPVPQAALATCGSVMVRIRSTNGRQQ